MLNKIIKKEILTALLDTRLQISGIILIVLMLTAVLVGRQGQKQIQLEREKAQASMQDKWLNQGAKHPHSAAHYGQFAFKPKSVLSFMDIGLDNYTGTSIFLEAHKQNEALFSAAQDSNSMTRFGKMTSAMIFQVLFPLLIIFLTFNIFGKEREEGTLKLIYAQGVSMYKLFISKVWGTYLIILMIFIPISLMAYFLLGNQSSSIDSSITAKFWLMMLGHSIYFLVFVLLCTYVSAFTKNSGFSLLTLLGIWILCCIILPKATFSLADKLYPIPSQFVFRKTINDKVKNGIDGHNPSDERFAALKEKTLKQYGVKSIKELPVNWSGIAMQAGEEFTDKVYDVEFLKISSIFKKQNQFAEWAGFINPYLAIRNLSMALAGTDLEQHILFTKAAENHRRNLVKTMNKDMEINQKPGMSYSDYKVDKEMWEKIKPFSYTPPNAVSILSYQWRSIITLGLWLILLFGLIIKFQFKISVL